MSMPNKIVFSFALFSILILTGCQSPSQFNAEQPGIASNTKALNNIQPSALPEIKQTDLEPLLKQLGLIDKINAWDGKLLFIKKDLSKKSSFQQYQYNSRYQDINNNQIMDSEDQGFFNPASTVKVGIAALALEKLNTLKLGRSTEYRPVGSPVWHSVEEDIKKMLVISDNEASNRLILWLGFQALNLSMQAKGVKHYAVNRLMLNQGTLIDSPAMEIRFESRIIPMTKQMVSISPACWEIKTTIGNCATATALTGILMRIIKPEFFSATEIFEIEESDRIWLQNIMSKSPKQLNFQLENTFCRFLHPISQKIANQSGRLISKCGIGLFNHTFVDSSFLQTDSDQEYFIIFSISPPQKISKNKAIKWMNYSTHKIIKSL